MDLQPLRFSTAMAGTIETPIPAGTPALETEVLFEHDSESRKRVNPWSRAPFLEKSLCLYEAHARTAPFAQGRRIDHERAAAGNLSLLGANNGKNFPNALGRLSPTYFAGVRGARVLLVVRSIDAASAAVL